MAAAVTPAEVVRCARCGHACPADAWRAQPTQRTLTREDLAGCVVGWPEDVVVEVRVCTSCGWAIARRRRSRRQ